MVLPAARYYEPVISACMVTDCLLRSHPGRELVDWENLSLRLQQHAGCPSLHPLQSWKLRAAWLATAASISATHDLDLSNVADERRCMIIQGKAIFQPVPAGVNQATHLATLL